MRWINRKTANKIQNSEKASTYLDTVGTLLSRGLFYEILIRYLINFANKISLKLRVNGWSGLSPASKGSPETIISQEFQFPQTEKFLVSIILPSTLSTLFVSFFWKWSAATLLPLFFSVNINFLSVHVPWGNVWEATPNWIQTKIFWRIWLLFSCLRPLYLALVTRHLFYSSEVDQLYIKNLNLSYNF